MHCEPPPITFIPCEGHFRPVLPTIEGNVDYLTLRGQLTTMDELLRTSGVENEFVTRSLKHWVKTLSQSKVEQLELISSRLRPFHSGISWFAVIPAVHQKNRPTHRCG